MSRRKISKNEPVDETVFGYAWYRREQWDRLREISIDVEELEDTYDEWVGNAELSYNEYLDSGMKIHKIDVDVEELLIWSKAENLQIDGSARSRYVAMKVHRLYEEKSNL